MYGTDIKIFKAGSEAINTHLRLLIRRVHSYRTHDALTA